MKRLLLLAALVRLLAADFDAARRRMVSEQIEARGVKDRDVLRAMGAVPRHLFVPDSLRSRAYDDRPLPIGNGQTISQPYIVALTTELLDVDPNHKVLEIGTGSGYQAAVLAQVAGRVLSVEIVPELAESARRVLQAQGARNVTVRAGDGYQGWPAEAPFDRIILTAAPPEIPQALLDQLKPGGKLVAPVGATTFTQQLVVVDKLADGGVKRRTIAPVAFVPMVRKP
jgi:protein-L-isoaspartate(D-aspartate) O-methyltransferase